MSRYRVKNDLQRVEFWAKDDQRAFRPLSALPENISEEDKKQYTQDHFVFKHPTWDKVALMHTVATGSGMTPFVDDKQLDKLLLKYFLVEASFFDLETKTDEDGMEFADNIDQFLSEVYPALIDFIILNIRQRM